jgi:lipid-binding SYLF domain-containing protein
MKRIVNGCVLTGLLLAIGACGDTAKVGDAEERKELVDRGNASLQDFYRAEPGIRDKVAKAYGYAIFPKIVTAAVGVGGAGGDGVVYEQGKLVGYADLSQASIGAQLGGQKYSELILFESATPLLNFQNGTWEVDAKATAVAAGSGSGTSADYTKGVLVYTQAEGGLMAQAAVGGQKFRYTKVGDYSKETK